MVWAVMAVDAAVRPIFGPVYIPMLYRVVVDGLHMVGKIAFIPNAVFPKPALPNGLLLLVGPATPHGRAFFGGHLGGKPTLDVLPVERVIAS